MQKNHSNLKETEEIWKLNSVYTCKLSWVIKWASVLKKTSLSTWQNWIILVNYINNGFPRWYSGKKKKKNVPANAGNARDVFLSLRWEDSLEEEMASNSNILAWRIPRTEEPGGLYSPWGCKKLDKTEHQRTHINNNKC